MNIKTMLLAFSVAWLASCGGGGGGGTGESTTNPTTPPPSGDTPATSPSGLYIGHYLEDAANNPEDPTAGSFYLHLPEGNARFSGEMSFTYVGCQSLNVGAVSGVKADLGLSGDWSGTVDGVPVGGPYEGRYDAATQRYYGTYQNSGGKVYVQVPNCIDYHVAAHGTWAMSPAEARSPEHFDLTVGGGLCNWADLAGVAWWLLSVFDEQATTQGTGAMVHQRLLPATTRSVPLASLGLVSGRAYILAVSGFDANAQPVGYTSTRHTAP